MSDLSSLLSQMTLEEKASLCSGSDAWHTQAIPRLGIPSIMLSDGPHGLRKQDLGADNPGINDSIRAVCFPAGCATAASFNRNLIQEMGAALGNECQAENVGVLLGPGVNIKRSPLCGRNFEYYSEDPCLAGEMAASFIKGVQSQHVGTSLKHFLANNQETRRLTVSSQIEERALHEIYLAAFEKPVREQQPWAVMCSYNKINGIYAAENHEHLTHTLRDLWAFDGLVVSDWGAVNDRVPDLEAGLDLEMPASGGANDALIVEAVRNGSLKEEVLDAAVRRILTLVSRICAQHDPNAVFDREADHEKARAVAEETIVLLKNEDILPLQEEQTVAFLGQFAEKPRYQGGGSSHINSSRVVSALEAAEGLPNIQYAPAFAVDSDQSDPQLLAQAVEVARRAKTAVIFAGLPDGYESEGYDRKHLRLPQIQNELIAAVAAVQPNTVVVLHNGAPVEMPWINQVRGVVEAYLSGQAVGQAVVDILFGRVNPSAKLPESFPIHLADTPSYLSFPGSGDESPYTEGIFVGYRYYDRKQMPVLFPFGHGLSYTTFEYSNLLLSQCELSDQDELTVSVDVTNTGSRVGKEVVQLYVAPPQNGLPRPVRELRDFGKVTLTPGETRTLSFRLGFRSFACWEPKIHDWYVPSGRYQIQIGASSRDIRLSGDVELTASTELPFVCTMDTSLGDLLARPQVVQLLKPLFPILFPNGLPEDTDSETEQSSVSSEAISKKMLETMIKGQPLHNLISFGGGNFTKKDLLDLIDLINTSLAQSQ